MSTTVTGSHDNFEKRGLLDIYFEDEHQANRVSLGAKEVAKLDHILRVHIRANRSSYKKFDGTILDTREHADKQKED